MVTYSILKHILLFHCLLLKPLTANLTYMQSISCTVLGWMKHKLESRLLGEVSITADLQVMPESEKAGLELNIQKTKSWHLVPSLHGK